MTETRGGWNRGLRKDFCVNGHEIERVGRNPNSGGCYQCDYDRADAKRRAKRRAREVRVIKMVYGVMVPNSTQGGYIVSTPLFEDKEEARAEAKRLTALRQRNDKGVPDCYVKLFDLVPEAK